MSEPIDPKQAQIQKLAFEIRMLTDNEYYKEFMKIMTTMDMGQHISQLLQEKQKALDELKRN